MHVRNISMLRRLGLAATAAGVGALVALPAFAEPPTFTFRQPRTAAPNQGHPHVSHTPHKPPLQFHPQTEDHPIHKQAGHPARVIIQHVPVHVPPHKSPARLQIVKGPQSGPLHKPHVNVHVEVVNRVLPLHQPHKPPPSNVKTSIEQSKPKVTQPEVIKPS